MTDRRASMAIWPEGERHDITRQQIASMQSAPQGGAAAQALQQKQTACDMALDSGRLSPCGSAACARLDAGASAMATAVAAIHSMRNSGPATGPDSRACRQRQQTARNDR